MEEINHIIDNKTPTGSRILDEVLNGGYEKDVITTIYGPAGAGKTVICILAAMTAVKNGKKVIYVDSEGGFSVERLKQVASSTNDDYKEILNGMIFLRPTSFDEQKKSFEKLKEIVNDKIGIIIVDSIAMLYRLELGKSEDFQEVNRELGRQIGYLTEIARKKNIPVLITNQIYMDFDEKNKVNIVGGDILKYGSKCLIELQITPDGNRRLIIRKHRNIQAEKELLFKIVEAGITAAKESKGFKLF
ncbi:MAG TPA: DNA repair and recombination protein RadB [Candidatus Nanoarchaeia archaeon]|nr:DNA repair and recombination protein RadB [Candidatus Nanoarchaeia archaeon]